MDHNARLANLEGEEEEEAHEVAALVSTSELAVSSEACKRSTSASVVAAVAESRHTSDNAPVPFAPACRRAPAFRTN